MAMRARRGLMGALAAALCAGLAPPVIAATVDQLRQECIKTVGRPIYQDCMKDGGERQSCLRKAGPATRSCVREKAAAAGVNLHTMANPRFRAWCTRPTGTYRNNQSFAAREAAGCFAAASHAPH